MLDSWRGIAACCVAFFHFRNSCGAKDVLFLQNSFLFVDFFFVLSGFVISSAYFERLRQGFGIGRFLWLRFWRLYPLHLLMLAAFVAVEAVQVVAPALAMGRQPFQPPTETAPTVLANIFMIHGLGVFDFLTWNGPSWSISVEFFTYAAFAAAVVLLGNRAIIPAFVTAAAAPLFLFLFNDGQNIDATFRYGVIRCLYGFSAGAICHGIYRRWLAAPRLTKRPALLMNISEIALTGLLVAFVCIAGTGIWSLAAPLLFSVVVLLFSLEAGLMSRFLKLRLFVFVGSLSYSIYMVHTFVLSRVINAAQVLQMLGGAKLYDRVLEGSRVNYILGTRLGPNYLVMSGLLAVTIFVSYFTYWLVENPGRLLSRRIALRRLTGEPGHIGRENVSP